MHPTLNRSSQSLFYSVPQGKRQHPCWGWKNMGESILHWEVGPAETKMQPNVGWYMDPACQNWFSFTIHSAAVAFLVVISPSIFTKV